METPMSYIVSNERTSRLPACYSRSSQKRIFRLLLHAFLLSPS